MARNATGRRVMSRQKRPALDSLDWQAARDKVQRMQTSAQATEMSPEQARAILDERARVLSQSPPEPPAADASRLELLTFCLGAERYGIETKYVREVVRLLDFTPVPGVPAFVVGVTNHRGQVLCIVDLRSFFAVPPGGLTDLARLIVVGVETVEFGVVADRTDAIGSLGTGDLLPPLDSIAGREYLLGVTRDALLVLDGAQLLQDSRLFIDHRETETP